MCKKLTRVSIPASVTSIENRAFELCSALAAVIFEGDAPILGGKVFAICAPGFKPFASPTAKGFTFPLWNNFRISGPSEEITILSTKNGTLLTSAKVGLGFSLVGTETEGQTFTIHNVGTRPLKNLSASIEGGNAGDFILKTSLRKTLAPGKSAEVKVSFKPLAIRKRSTTVIIRSSDSDEPEYRIILKGSGVIAID